MRRFVTTAALGAKMSVVTAMSVGCQNTSPRQPQPMPSEGHQPAVNQPPDATAASEFSRGQEGADDAREPTPQARDWDCSALIPADATLRRADVLVVVRVGPDGRALSVRVVRDPGQGFGAAAGTCVMRQRYRPALDHAGVPVVGETVPFRVRFTR
jgi:Gram-negative bacterial TonB protein C-terminal